MDINDKCGKDRKRREVSSDVVTNLQNTAKSMDNFKYVVDEIMGDEKMYSINSVWYESFKASATDVSSGGILLSEAEFITIIDTINAELEKDTLRQFLHRWNDTAAAWENGTLNELTSTKNVINLSSLTTRVDQYLRDSEAASDKGFNSIFAEFDNAVRAYKTAEASERTSSKKDSAICAKVRIRIQQNLVLTRAAFIAKLEMENGERHKLEDINVEIQIRQTGSTGELDNHKFSIGSPKLIGISAVDGTGSLGQDLSGSAEWLIIPYTSAAPIDDILYDIGGRLSYRVGSSDFSTILLPDTVTVKSNPSLVVHYFHEKYVRGDDPLTKTIEPIVPFSLCVSVMNAGYGIANALKITSGQPEIIENEKGLLIAFKIIGAHLQGKPITPSLSIDFGDIRSHETKTACWLLTTSLMGTFYNYSATFENINPLGDPQLSLLEKLDYHELIHLVRIEDSGDDLDDFLVNDKVDPDGMPDRVFSSVDGSVAESVSIANVTEINVYSMKRSGSKMYTIINLHVSVEHNSTWLYVRVENNITSPQPSPQENLIRANRLDGKDLLLENNVWQTTHILDKFLIHIFDGTYMNETDDSTHGVFSYNLTYGPRNMYPPQFSSASYSVNISTNAITGMLVLQLEAHDSDRDTFTFAMANSSLKQFTVDEGTGSIYLASKLSEQLYKFEVVVYDHGIPSKSSTAKVFVYAFSDSQNFTSSTDKTTTEESSDTSTHMPTSMISGKTSQKPRIPSTTEKAERDEDDGISPWIIPTAVGVGVLILVVLVIAISVYIYRRNKSGTGNQGTDYKLHRFHSQE